MREILFRGKPKSNNEYYCFSKIWKDNCKNGFVYGSLIVQADKYFICVSTVGVKMNCCINNSTVSMIEVIPETVGQYTGLTDKNDKKIFKGDILRRAYYPEDDVVIEWSDGSFRFRKANKPKDYGYSSVCCIQNAVSSLKIVGNIYDNSELLKEE